MKVVTAHGCTEWLSLAQVKTLLDTGELEIISPGGRLRLFVNFIDRVAAHQLAAKPEVEET